MQVDVLASGSKGNSTLIRSEQACILIDCGMNKKYLSTKLKELGVSLDDIQAVLITHAHSDHVAALKYFAHLPVFSWCDLKNVSAHRQIGPDMRFLFKDLRIDTIPLSHDARNTLGFIICSGSEKLVYVTDTGYVQARSLDKMRDATYFVFESNHDVQMLFDTSRPMFLKQRIAGASGHLNNEDSAQALGHLVGPDTRSIVLAHLSEEANEPKLALQVLKDHFAAIDLDASNIEIKAAAQYEITHVNPGTD